MAAKRKTKRKRKASGWDKAVRHSKAKSKARKAHIPLRVLQKRLNSLARLVGARQRSGG